METGKVEYSPDYESKVDMSARAVVARTDKIIAADLKRQAEHQRLKDAVVEAARGWRFAIAQDVEALISEENQLRTVVNALIEFESNQRGGL